MTIINLNNASSVHSHRKHRQWLVDLESSHPILVEEVQPLFRSASHMLWKCRPRDSISSECEKKLHLPILMEKLQIFKSLF